MQAVYDRLQKENLPFKILMQQGNAKQAETLEKFRNDTNSVLLGTGSYWEGINIEGVSLSHVIIFKLPFPVREPIIDYKYQQSKDGLMEVSVPEMVIKLKQGKPQDRHRLVQAGHREGAYGGQRDNDDHGQAHQSGGHNGIPDDDAAHHAQGMPDGIRQAQPCLPQQLIQQKKGQGFPHSGKRRGRNRAEEGGL